MKNRLIKLVYVAVTILLFTACNQVNNNADAVTDTTTVATVGQAIKDTLKVADDPVLSIRRMVEHINTTKIDSQHVEFTCDEKTKVDHFYEDGKVVKISVDFGTIGDVYAKEDYYYDNGKLIFMYEYVEGGPACDDCIKTNEYRYYINDGKVFKYLKDKSVAKCRKCEFSPNSRQVKLMQAKTAKEIKAIVCR